MPEISELLDRAAPGAGGPAPLDDIVRRGRRRKAVARGAAVGAPLAVVAVVATAVVLVGGSPAGVIVDDPPMANTPSPDTRRPVASPSPSPDRVPPAPGGGEATEPPDTSGWVQPTGLAADVLLVEADGMAPRVHAWVPTARPRTCRSTTACPTPQVCCPTARRVRLAARLGQRRPAPVLHAGAGVAARPSSPRATGRRDHPVGWHLEPRSGPGHRTARRRLRGHHGRPAVVRSTAAAATPSGRASARGRPASHTPPCWRRRSTTSMSRRCRTSSSIPPDGDPEVLYEAGEITGEDIAGDRHRRGVRPPASHW